MRKKLNQYFPAIMMMIALACVGSVALARQPAPDPNNPDPNDPNNPDPQQVHVVGGGGSGAIIVTTAGGPMPGRFRLGGPQMMMGGVLEQFVNMLGTINLKPDFTLTVDQKTKIQAIRDDFKQQHEAWKSQHADELKQLDEQQEELFAGLQQGNPPDPGQMMELEEQRRVLHETAPNGEDHVAQMKALFTPEQAKLFETYQAQIEKEREAMSQQMPGARFIRGVSGVRATPPTPPAPPTDPDDKKK